MPRSFIYLIVSAFIVYGCGTPNDPEQFPPGDGGYKIISKYATPGYLQDVVVEDTIAYLAQGEGGLLMLNVKDPRHPFKIGEKSDSLKGYSYKILKKDSAIYMAAGNFGVSVINVADPFNPKLTLTNLDIKPSRDMIIHQNYLFTSVSELGVMIADISYPTQPDIRGDIVTPGYARGLCVIPDSNYLLVACGEMGMALMDISIMANGFGYYPKAGWCDTQGYAEDVVTDPEGHYAYLACGTGGLAIIDYSDTSDIKIVGTYDTGGYAKEIEFKNNKIFLTTELRGLQVFDVSDVTKPVRLASIDTEYALGFTMDENYIYIADEIEGLIIISIPQ